MQSETQPESTEPKVADHVKSVMEQLNRAQAFAGSPKARKLYRDALRAIEALREFESRLTDRICVTMMENAELRAQIKRALNSTALAKEMSRAMRAETELAKHGIPIPPLPNVAISQPEEKPTST